MTVFDFFCQMVGFLAQTQPVVLLSLVFFPDEVLRDARRRLMLFDTLMMLVLGLGLACGTILIWKLCEAANDLMPLFGNGYMLLALVLYGVVFFRSVRESALKKVTVLVLLIHYAAIQFTLVNVLMTLYYSSVGDRSRLEVLAPYGSTSVFFYLLLILVMLPPVALFLQRVVRPALAAIDEQHLRRACGYFMAALLLYCCAVFALSSAMSLFLRFDPMVLLLLMAFIVTDAMFYAMFFSEVRLADEKHQLEDQLRSFDEQYQQISIGAAEFRRFRHDMRHHLNMIASLNSAGRHEELAAYLARYTETFADLEQKPLSGNASLDAILHYYLARAESEAIKVSTHFSGLPERFKIDVVDLTVLLGNLLENAIHAAERLPTSARWLRVNAGVMNDALYLLVENACVDDGARQSTYVDAESYRASGRHGHGQGLTSIRLIAEKYGGSAEFKKDDGVFSARVVLNLG